MAKQKVYLIGAGPGKSDLITVRGQNILKNADVVIYDYLVDKKILENAPKNAELICADELGKRRYADKFSKTQEKISNFIVKRSLSGKKVVRLKNGDPSIFGRLSQELIALVKHKIEFEVVPGITSGIAAAAFSGIPLTDRNLSSSVIFVTGHEKDGKPKQSIDFVLISKLQTIVFYMAIENLEKIADKLIKYGKSKRTPAAIISNAGSIGQKIGTGTLSNIAINGKKSNISSPAIVIIGEVAKLEESFDWFKKNKRVLFTGLSDERYFMQGTYFHIPLIKIEPISDYREFDNHLAKINSYDWIIFSSRFGVEYFFRQFFKLGLDSRVLNGLKIGAVGNITRSRLRDFGIIADFVPKVESAAGLINEIKKHGIKNKKIFMPRSDLADKGLKNGLEKLGAKVASSVAYSNVIPKDLPDIDFTFFDEIMFSSPSAVRNFIARYKGIPKNVKVRYIGDVTKNELIAQGIRAK